MSAVSVNTDALSDNDDASNPGLIDIWFTKVLVYSHNHHDYVQSHVFVFKANLSICWCVSFVEGFPSYLIF
jgi:hypothetical protein